jgi:hypothetical protein
MPPGMIGPARQLQNERSVTSEYYEMYSSFTPNASAANLEEMPTKRDSYYFNGNTNSEVRPVSLQEFGFEEEEESAKKEALERRHTAPLEATLVDVSLIDTRNESQRRHQSLPTYTAALANINIEGDSEEEEEEEDEKQQDEEWIFNTALPKRTVTRSTSVRDEKQQHVRLPQRSKTMAARTIQSYENPFQSDTEKDHSSLHSDDEESSDDDDDDKKPSDSPTDYRSHYDGPF